MNRSQLRRLALDHAQGEIQFEDYTRERKELIDAIAAGKITIAREVPRPLPVTPQSADEPDPTRAETVQLQPPPLNPSPRLSPVYVGVGAVVIAGIAWAVLSGSDPEPPPRVVAEPVVAPVPTISAAEQLVTGFITNNNWNRSNTEKFLEAWIVLSDGDRSDARTSPWFNPFSSALRQEINARHALAGLSGGGADRLEGMRLIEFARALGLSKQFPSFGGDDDGQANANGTQASASEQPTASFANVSREATATAATIDTAMTATTKTPLANVSTQATTRAANAGTENSDSAATKSRTDEPVQSTPAQTASNNNGSVSSTTVALMPQPTATSTPQEATASSAPLTDVDWFSVWRNEQLTLQLHVVSRIDEIERVIARHPDVDLRVLEVSDSNGSMAYRVVHGLYNSGAAARDAFKVLPTAVRAGQNFALVKSVGELKALGARGHYSHLSRQFTVQLFVFDSSDNAEKLVARYPDLPLRVHRGQSANSKYRVLHGYYASADQARSVARQLPSTLLQEAKSTPVVKRVDNPGGAAISR